ncbi:hypothetical protein EDD86DRAFT_199402 [Gorgonomyces haynaldii]|nr:hypothetical protein EDD86DRAFT_199402 [Gorgonomyces haynaldii]
MGQVQEDLLPAYAQAIIVGFGAACYCLSYASVLISMWSKYPPLKARQLPVLLMGTIVGTIWFIGTLAATPAINQVGIFSFCPLYMIWFQVTFGVSLLLLLLNFRLLRLYYIIVLIKKPQGWSFYGILFINYLPTLAVSVWSAIAPLGSLVSTNPGKIAGLEKPVCHFVLQPFKFALFGSVALQLLSMLYLNYKLTYIRKAFNEYKENRFAIAVAVFCLFFNLAIQGLGFNGANWARTSIVVSQVLAGNIMVWSSLFKPLRGYFFDYEGHLKYWADGLKMEGLPTPLRYGVSSETSKNSYSMSATSSSQPMSFVRSGDRNTVLFSSPARKK